MGAEMMVVDLATGKPIFRKNGLSYGVSFHPSGRWLAYSAKNNVQICEIPSGGAVKGKLDAGSSYLCHVQFSADGKRLAAGNGDGTVRVWNVTEA